MHRIVPGTKLCTCAKVWLLFHALVAGDLVFYEYNHRQVLNMTCIILSDILQTEKDEALEFYSTLPFLFRELPYSLNRIVFTKNNRGKIKFNQSLSCKSDLLSKSASQISNPFGIIHQLELNFDLYFWEKNQGWQQRSIQKKSLQGLRMFLNCILRLRI